MRYYGNSKLLTSIKEIVSEEKINCNQRLFESLTNSFLLFFDKYSNAIRNSNIDELKFLANEYNLNVNYDYEKQTLFKDLKEELNEITNVFNNFFLKIVKYTHENKIPFIYGSFESFLTIHSEEIKKQESVAFSVNELEVLKNLADRFYNEVYSSELHNVLKLDNKQAFISNNKLKGRFIFSKFKELNFEHDIILSNRKKYVLYVRKLEDKEVINQNSREVQLNENNITEISESNAVQKIIYLNELGVIDFLRLKQPFNTTTNSLATILATILGEKTTTIQPYLNALINDSTESNKHPYFSKTSAEKVKQQLINIGFKS